MTIQEAIKQRIERFNRLWIKAVGYSFEDEVEIMKKERDNAVNKANERAKEIGYSDYQEYIEKLNSFYAYDKTMGYQLSDEVSYNKTKDNVLGQLRPPKGGRLSKGCHPLAWHVDECSY